MGYGQVHLGEVDVHAKFCQLWLSSLGIRGWFVFCAEVLGGFMYTRLYVIDPYPDPRRDGGIGGIAPPGGSGGRGDGGGTGAGAIFEPGGGGLRVIAKADKTWHEHQPPQGVPDHTPKPDLSLKRASTEAFLCSKPGSMKMALLRLHGG